MRWRPTRDRPCRLPRTAARRPRGTALSTLTPTRRRDRCRGQTGRQIAFRDAVVPAETTVVAGDQRPIS
eukprot:3713481-Prymnesium_polylepis.1